MIECSYSKDCVCIPVDAYASRAKKDEVMKESIIVIIMI